MSSEFNGHVSELKKPSPWLASEDIVGRGDIKVVIEAVYKHENVEFEQGRKEKKVFTIKYKGKEKQHIINATNRSVLRSRFGPDVQKWKGQEVTLYVDENVKMMGKTVCGIRIR